ncbi:hypothetical protein BCR35DRAFT_325725 [Leucosporidium creatinivorum]|uniref:HMG box domain-containing protein n=1 Tax=Leucosporidium creatinivorum TaxID=106004 RepID=A0A1Y2EWP5_9BASI|nr:hypothetical protein BCR35DRAFT_325725 [Leucosporidium creatinivorum]
MVLTRRGSAQLEAAAARPSSSAANNSRFTAMPRNASSPAVDASRPSLPIASSLSSASSALPLPMHVSSEASFALPRRPSDEWREFFNLDNAQSTSRREGKQGSEGIEAGAEEQEAPWTTMFPGELAFGGVRPPPSAAPVESSRMYPQQLARGSFESASSIASSFRDVDSHPSHSVVSSAPTSLAASPVSCIDAGSPAPSVLQAAPSAPATRPSSHPSVPSVLLSGYSSIMPRRNAPSTATSTTTTKSKPRKGRKGKSAIEASSGAETSSAAYLRGVAEGLSRSGVDRSIAHDSVSASMPHSAPASTTTFSRRLATHEGIVKNIKAEDPTEHNFIPPTPAPVPSPVAKPVLRKASVESVDDIAPAVATAPASRPRKPKVRPEGHTPRPPNAWILYRSAQIQILKSDEEISKKPQSDISKLIGYMWRDEAPAVRKYYEEQAALKKAEHSRLYPDYTFCPVRKPKAGGVASTNSSRASTPAAEPSGSVARPPLSRRATAPSSRTSPYSPRKRRVTSDADFAASQSVTVHMPPSVLGLDFGLSMLPRNDTQAFVPHSAGPYQSDFPLECGMDALFSSFSQSMPATPVGGFPMSASPSVSSFRAHLDATSAIEIDVNGHASADPTAYAAWSTFEASTPNYFPEHNPLDLLPQAPMSAPAAFSTFDFGPVPSIFDSRPLPSPSPTSARSFSGFEPVGSASTSASFPIDTNGLDMTSPTTTESSLASPTDARFPYEQWMPAPMEMQWEGAEGACGDVGEAEYKRRFSAQWMSPQASQQAVCYPQVGMQDYSFPSTR